jgi:hypothetical protein
MVLVKARWKAKREVLLFYKRVGEQKGAMCHVPYQRVIPYEVYRILNVIVV